MSKLNRAWVLSFFGVPASPNTDETLRELLDLRPRIDAERQKYNDAAVLKQIRRNPGSVGVQYQFKTIGGDGRGGTTSLYPIFRIIALGGSFKTIKACGAAYPDAFVSQTDVGSTLLHAACIFKSTARDVKWIYSKNPALVKVANKHGFTPLHCACAYGSSVQVVKLLMKWYPGALKEKNKLNETPYDSAINNCASDEVCSLVNSENEVTISSSVSSVARFSSSKT